MWLIRWWRRTPPREVATEPAVVNPRAGLVAWLTAGTVTLTVISPLVVAGGSDLKRTAFVAVTVGVGVTLAIAVLLAAAWHLVHIEEQPTPKGDLRHVNARAHDRS